MEWTQRLLLVGSMLLVVGAGNWYTGERKVGEYSAALATRSRAATAAPSPDFPHLDARMTQDLLAPLRHAGGVDQHASAKLDFYQVVRTGGRMLTMLGLGACATAGLARRYRRRHESGLSLEPRSY